MKQERLYRLKGFTIIELVLTVVIIGVLAAIAMPRFSAIKTNAYAGTMQDIARNMRVAVNNVHAAWIAAGASGAPSTVTLDGKAISVNANGWPDNGITGFSMGPTAPCTGTCSGQTILNYAGNCAALLSFILQNPPQSISVISQCTEPVCLHSDWSGNATGVCSYKIYDGTSSGGVPTINYSLITGAVGVCVSNCGAYYNP